MKHGSLFSGIGGFDLAAEWMGWENKFYCEWEDFPRSVLKHYWPNAISYGDIKQTDFTIHRGQINILTGGFPCQPYSQAGKRLGKEDERHLWPEMLRAIREIKPTWIVGENVRGLVNWSGGLVFEEVCADLEAEGYEVQPFLLPACGVNAPHRRNRIWFVAYSDNARTDKQLRNNRKKQEENKGRKGQPFIEFGQGSRNAPDSNGKLRERRDERTKERRENEGKRTKPLGDDKQGQIPSNWQNFPTQPPICGGDDGLPTELDGITFPKWRNESIKAYGNAVVPQVVYEIFKAIQAYEDSPGKK